ncbi:MAG: lipid asymmetry maintenance protein MlaB [Gammaproteobacteria bacterium]
MRKTAGTAGRKGGRGSVLSLPADLGIESAHELHAALAARVGDAAPVTVDGSAVSRVHAASIQLLLMFFRDRRGAGRETAWRQASDTLSSAAALLGVARSIQLSEVNP